MPNRNLLHRNKLPEFEMWLVEHGWMIEDLPHKSNFQALRAVKDGRRIIIYSRLNSHHMTVTDNSINIVREFIKDSHYAKTR